MSIKPFRLGVIVGRFQVLHLGHEDIIKTASSICERLCIMVGSAQECGTAKNPLDYSFRKEMLKTVCPDNVEIYPLRDAGIGNNSGWGLYVNDVVISHTGEKPDLFISGKEERRVSWYSEINCAELTLPKTRNVSASEVRQAIMNNDSRYIENNLNPLLFPFIPEIRKALELSENNQETDSI